MPGTAVGAGAGRLIISVLVVPELADDSAIKSKVNAHKTTAPYFLMDSSLSSLHKRRSVSRKNLR